MVVHCSSLFGGQVSDLPSQFPRFTDQHWHMSGLYVLFMHMVQMRRKVFGVGRTLGSKPKSKLT